MKSLAMIKFSRISPSADFYSKLLVLNKNILYITYTQDKILKIVNRLAIDKDLQEQANEAFEDDETSPQTEIEGK